MGAWSLAEGGGYAQPLVSISLKNAEYGQDIAFEKVNQLIAAAPVRPQTALDHLRDYLDRYFQVSQRGSTVEREVVAGLVTWVTMSYIVVVNPTILSAASADAGSPIPFHSACRATCLSAAVGSAFVGLFANLPFGLAAGMGLNSYVRYGVIGRLGLSPQAALATCATQAGLFGALAASGAADRLQALVPAGMKSAITVAIGVFQAFVGFQLMGLIVKSDTTLVALGDVMQPSVWLVFSATLLVAALIVRRTKGALLLGIAFTAISAHALGLPDKNAAALAAEEALYPAGGGAALGLFDLGFGAALEQPQEFGTAVLCMLFIVLFDTAGVQHGIGQQAGLLESDGSLPGNSARLTYLGSALATAVGALMGTSPVIIHNESAAGVQEGGRTGLTAVVTAVLFLASPAMVPLIELIPPEATAPCLILVGTMMMAPVRDIDFSDLQMALPAFLTICVTPLAYSISAGIAAGLVSYFVLGAVLRLAEAAGHLGDAMGAALAGRGFQGGRGSVVVLPEVQCA